MGNDNNVPGAGAAGKNLRDTLIGLAVFFCGAAVLHFLLYTKPYADVVSNLKYLMSFSVMGADGLLPYRDVPVEYPPLGAAWLWAFIPCGGDMEKYRAAFTAGMTLWALAGLLAVWRVADRFAGPENPRVKVTLLYTGLLVAAGPICLVSFDFMAVALAAWALALKLEGRGLPAAGVLAVGVAAKMFPAVLLPLFLLHTFRRDGFSKAAREFFVFAAVSSVLFGIPFLLAPQGFVASFTYHLGRGVEAGSVYAAIIHAARLFGGGEVPTFSHGSWGFEGGVMSNLLGTISTFALLVMFAAVYFIFIVKSSGDETEEGTGHGLEHACAAVILAFLIGFKVGSPQFFAWTIPFMAVSAVSKIGRSPYFYYVAACVLSQLVFPWFWEDLIFANPLPITLLVLEKILLFLSLTGILILALKKPDSA